MAIDICTLVQENYGINVSKCYNTREGWIIEDAQTNHLLLCQQSQLRKEKILGTFIILNHLNTNGFTKTDKYINTLKGIPYVQHASLNYVLLSRNSGSECNIENLNDVANASRLLAEMHLSATGFTSCKAIEALTRCLNNINETNDTLSPQDCTEKDYMIPELCISNIYEKTVDSSAPYEEFNLNYYIKNDLGKTQEIFNKRFDELKKFKKTAKKNNNKFDYAYLQIADYYCELAGQICSELNSSPYVAITEKYKNAGCICHRDYTGHNIVLGNNESILNFENSCIDLPIYDIANFIRRRMRKCGWSVSDAYLILDNYSKVRTLSNDEVTVLKLLLQFPQKLWRIINKYYNSRRSWCEKSCLAKLDEIIQEKEPLEQFAKNF